jgi:hypothetical protein
MASRSADGTPVFVSQRAPIAVGVVSICLLAANLWGTYEPGRLDGGPFAAPWASCDTIAHGWPWSAVRRAAVPPVKQPCDPTATCVPSPCEYLPALDLFALVADGAVACLLIGLTAFLFRGPWLTSRVAHSTPSVDAPERERESGSPHEPR